MNEAREDLLSNSTILPRYDFQNSQNRTTSGTFDDQEPEETHAVHSSDNTEN
jgi:hypothetical protein